MSLTQKHLTDNGWKTCVAASPDTCTAKYNGKSAPHKALTQEDLLASLDKVEAGKAYKTLPNGGLSQKELEDALSKVKPPTGNSFDNQPNPLPNKVDGKIMFTMSLQKDIDRVSAQKIITAKDDLDFSVIPAPKKNKTVKPVENEWGIIEPPKPEPTIPISRTVTGKLRTQMLDIFTGFGSSNPTDVEDQVASRGRDVVIRLLGHVDVPRHQVEDFLTKSDKNFNIVKTIIQDSIKIVS